MVKKFLAKLMSWEGQQKSNWTEAVEAEGLSGDERKNMTDKAKEELKKEWIRKKEAQEQAQKEELKKPD